MIGQPVGADAGFVEELRDWLVDHLTAEFKATGPVGGPTSDSRWELRCSNSLCTKSGDGVPALDGQLIQLEEAKALPASD
jgi:hypothetical protein